MQRELPSFKMHFRGHRRAATSPAGGGDESETSPPAKKHLAIESLRGFSECLRGLRSATNTACSLADVSAGTFPQMDQETASSRVHRHRQRSSRPPVVKGKRTVMARQVPLFGLVRAAIPRATNWRLYSAVQGLQFWGLEIRDPVFAGLVL